MWSRWRVNISKKSGSGMYSWIMYDWILSIVLLGCLCLCNIHHGAIGQIDTGEIFFKKLKLSIQIDSGENWTRDLKEKHTSRSQTNTTKPTQMVCLCYYNDIFFNLQFLGEEILIIWNLVDKKIKFNKKLSNEKYLTNRWIIETH